MAGSTPRKQSRIEGIPWLALASLLVVLVCGGASIGIIITSDSQTVKSWKIQPAVLLAILTSISTVALGIAFSAAVVVTWWTCATEGASLAQLHYIWDRGEGVSFLSAFAAGANARRVALAASVIVISKLATNPLLQRATHQRIDEIAMRQTIRLNIAQYIPEGWFGSKSIMDNQTLIQEITTDWTSATILDWWKDATINSLDAPGYYCDGTCEGTVQGAGIYHNCSSTTETIDLQTNHTVVEIFAVMTTLTAWTTVKQNSTSGAPSLLLKTLHPSAIANDTCTLTLTIDTCKIETGIVEYPIILQNSTVTLDPDKPNNVTVVSTYVYPGDLLTMGEETSLGPLFLLGRLFGYSLLSNGSQYYSDSTYETGISQRFREADRSSYDDYTFEKCPMKWYSPTDYVLNSMQNVMFRAALRAANSTDVQEFTVRRTKLELVFQSVYGYLAAASAITLLGLLITLFMLQGWWVLGRTVTLSPLETAKAFRAPLMESADNDATVDGLLGDVGQAWVKYADGVMTVHYNRDIVKEEGHIHGVEAQGRSGENESQHRWSE